jgi:hypothetical protein
MRNRSQSLTAIFLAIALFIPATVADAAGRSAKTASNTILNGKGAPKISLGIDGDFYIDTRSLLIYGPKTKGRWPVPTNLQGPTGPAGNPGKSATTAKTAASVSTSSGPQGAQGPIGPKGEAGLPGEPGASGAAGKDGAAGSPGAAGGSGGSGPAGGTGPAGGIGNTGPAGATGPVGETPIIYGQLTFNDFTAASNSAQSVTIGGFESHTSYVVRVRIFLYQPLDSSEFFLPLSLTVNSPIGSPVVHTGYFLSHGYSFRVNPGRYENSIYAEIVLDGTAMDATYEISLRVAVGRNTSSTGMAKGLGDFTASVVSSTRNYL